MPDAALLNPVETPHPRRGPGSPSGRRVATRLAETGDPSVFIRVHLWFPSRLEPQMNTDEHGSSSGGNTKAQGAGRGTVRLAVARQHPTAMLPVRSSVHGGAWLPCPPSPPVSPVVHLSFQAPRELGGGNHDAHRSGFTLRVKSPGPTGKADLSGKPVERTVWHRSKPTIGVRTIIVGSKSGSLSGSKSAPTAGPRSWSLTEAS